MRSLREVQSLGNFGLAPADDDSAARIVRGQCNRDPVAKHDTDVVHTQLATKMGEDLVAVIESRPAVSLALAGTANDRLADRADRALTVADCGGSARRSRTGDRAIAHGAAGSPCLLAVTKDGIGRAAHERVLGGVAVTGLSHTAALTPSVAKGFPVVPTAEPTGVVAAAIGFASLAARCAIKTETKILLPGRARHLVASAGWKNGKA